MDDSKAEKNADEILVDAAKGLRGNPGPGEYELVNRLNEHMVELFSAART